MNLDCLCLCLPMLGLYLHRSLGSEHTTVCFTLSVFIPPKANDPHPKSWTQRELLCIPNYSSLIVHTKFSALIEMQ